MRDSYRHAWDFGSWACERESRPKCVSLTRNAWDLVGLRIRIFVSATAEDTMWSVTYRRTAHIAKAQSRLGSINRIVASGCEIDKVTSAEIAFAIFIAKHNLPMAVGDEFGLLPNKMWCTTVPVAPPGGGKILTTAFHAFSSGLSRFFVRWCWHLWYGQLPLKARRSGRTR